MRFINIWEPIDCITIAFGFTFGLLLLHGHAKEFAQDFKERTETGVAILKKEKEREERQQRRQEKSPVSKTPVTQSKDTAARKVGEHVNEISFGFEAAINPKFMSSTNFGLEAAKNPKFFFESVSKYGVPLMSFVTFNNFLNAIWVMAQAWAFCYAALKC